MLEIPLKFASKNRGEEWFVKGAGDALQRKPMQAEKEITRRRWGNIPGRLAWDAYKAGYEAQKASMGDIEP